MLEGLNKLSIKIAEQAQENGGYNDVEYMIADNMPQPIKTLITNYGLIEKLTHLHSEVSECYKAILDYDTGNFEEEITDVLIMTLSIMGTLRIDVETNLFEKFIFNEDRDFAIGLPCRSEEEVKEVREYLKKNNSNLEIE